MRLRLIAGVLLSSAIACCAIDFEGADDIIERIISLHLKGERNEEYQSDVERTWFHHELMEDLETKGKRAMRLNVNICGRVPLFHFDVEEGFNCSSSERRADKEVPRRDAGHSRLLPKSRFISGGMQVELGQFPSFARLDIFARDHHGICSGTLVAPNLVLTAGHCIVDTPGPIEKIQVRLGITSVSNYQFSTLALGHCLMRGYQDTHSSMNNGVLNDVALVVLPSSVPLTDHIQVACVAWDVRHRDDAQCFTVGMGKSHEGDKDFARVYALPVKRHCRNIPAYNLADRTCFMSNSRLQGGACQGDSGGPTYCFSGCTGSQRQIVVAGSSWTREEGKCPKGDSEFYCSDYYKLGAKLSKLVEICRIERYKTAAANESRAFVPLGSQET